MYKKKLMPLFGRITRLSSPISDIDAGMSFLLDDWQLLVSQDGPISSARAMEVFFGDVAGGSTVEEVLIEGALMPFGDYIAIYSRSKPWVKDGGICVPVTAYWVIGTGSLSMMWARSDSRGKV